MSKTLKLFALCMVLTFVLAACGGKTEVTSTAPTKEVAAPTEAPPTASAPEGIAGAYTVAGTNPDGSNYEGSLEVTASGEAFKWSWNDGEYSGVGLQQGNVVSVGWGGDACYVVSYVIEENGVLNGIWTDMALSGIGADVATPTDNMGEGLEGLYNIAGKNPDGSDYGCSLQVTKKGDVYEWYWFSCGEFTGVGIQDENVVSVAYGSETCSAISYHVEDDGTLKGTWAYVGTSELGTEVDTR